MHYGHKVQNFSDNIFHQHNNLFKHTKKTEKFLTDLYLSFLAFSFFDTLLIISKDLSLRGFSGQ